MGGLDARAFARRPRDECRAARNRRPHSHPRDLLQRAQARERKPGVHRGSSMRRWRTASPTSPISPRPGRSLRRTPSGDRRLACVLSDYPAKGGRVGYAVGLDTPASVASIAEALRGAGYDVGAPVEAEALIAHLVARADAGRPVARRLRASLCRAAGGIPARRRRGLGRARRRPGRERRRVPFSASCAPASCWSPCSPIAADVDARKGEYHDLALRAAPRLCRVLHLAARGRTDRRARFISARTARSNGCRAKRSRCRRIAPPRRRSARCP